MDSVVKGIIKHLMNNADVYAAFANRITAEKIPDVKIPENPIKYPCAVLWVVTAPRSYTHQGPAGRVPIVQIDVFDDDQAGADANSLLIENTLSGYRGMLGSEVNAGFVSVNRGPDMWNPDERNYRRILEVTVRTND
ncbi:MAG: hypothetical protein WC455_25695 [Dehalococcoidia bacterium]|jgi:hypothetical protein